MQGCGIWGAVLARGNGDGEGRGENPATCYFLRPRRALTPFVEFGFLFRAHACPWTLCGTRPPTGGATLFFALELGARGEAAVSGLFCDGPRTERCSASPRFREAVGLKVRVGALQAVVGIPAKHLVNQRVPLEAIWGRDAFELADRIAGATSAAQRLQILEKELMRQAQRRAELHPIASHIAALIDQTGGQVRIHDLADACGMSERALRYKFDDCAGLTPKQYTRLVRLRACIARLDASHIDWAGLAVDCGFHDQSHMIHEFQELVGASPTEFVRQRAANNGIVARTVESDVVSDRKRRLYQMSGFVSKWVEG